VRWALGVSLRLPYERTYPSQMPNPIAYDKVLTDIVAEDCLRARISNLLQRKPRRSLQLQDIAQALEVPQDQAHDCLKEMGREGLVSIVLINRTAHYGLQQ
jgi:hypothetical protein